MKAPRNINNDFDAVKGEAMTEILGQKPTESKPDITLYNYAERLVNPVVDTLLKAQISQTYVPMDEVKKALWVMASITKFMEDQSAGLPADVPAEVIKNIKVVRDLSELAQNPDYLKDVVARTRTKFAAQISKLEK